MGVRINLLKESPLRPKDTSSPIEVAPRSAAALPFSTPNMVGDILLSSFHSEDLVGKIWKETVELVSTNFTNGTKQKLADAFNVLIVKGLIEVGEGSFQDNLTHNLQVARLLAKWGCEPDVVIAGLLTEVPMENVTSFFDEHIVDLLKRKENLSREELQLTGNTQSERNDCRNRLIASEDNPNVHLLKAADEYITLFNPARKTKAKRIAMHALYVTSVLLKLLKKEEFAYNMEEIAFHHAYPEEYDRWEGTLAELNGKKDKKNMLEMLDALCKDISSYLIKNGIKNTFQKRIKRHYALWVNEEQKKKGEDITRDANQIRFIIEMDDEEIKQWETDNKDPIWIFIATIAKDYFVAQGWITNPERDDRNYIANPKTNGYRSYHVSFEREKRNFPISFQLRSRKMHEQAERGKAAHWRYKEKDIKRASFEEERRYLAGDSRKK